MSIIWTFDNKVNKHTLYRGEDCMKNICTPLREHATNVINFEKKKMLPLTKEELKSYQDGKVGYICAKRFLKKFANDIHYRKIRNYCHYTGKYRHATHSICNLKFNVPNEIPVVFYNGLNDYHFIMKELTKEFEGELECFEENTEKHKTFSVAIEMKVL